MSLFRRSVVGLGLSLDSIAAAVPTTDAGSWRVQSAPLSDLPAESMGHVLDSLFAQHASAQSRINVVFAPEILREWIMDVPAGVQSLDELRMLATARFTQLYGLAPDDWTITADWTTRGPMLCTAAPSTRLKILRAELARRGFKSSVSTMLCRVLADIPSLPNEAWLCIHTHRCLSLLLIRRRSLRFLRTLRSAGADRNQQLANVVAEMHRACLRSGFAPARCLHWYDCSHERIRPSVIDGVEIVAAGSRTLQQMAAVAIDTDSCVAACMGAAL